MGDAAAGDRTDPQRVFRDLLVSAHSMTTSHCSAKPLAIEADNVLRRAAVHGAGAQNPFIGIPHHTREDES